MVKTMNRAIRIMVVFFLLIMILSCKHMAKSDLRHIVSNEICVIHDEMSNMGFPLSMDIVSDELFVITDGLNVFLYDMDGKYIRSIGAPGNAKNEYNRPAAVKAYGDSIYVWSSMSLSFLSYGLDGTPGAVYSYSSAVSDFVARDAYLVIYTAGVRGNHVIDIIKKDGTSITGIHEASEKHKLLCSNASTVPLCCKDDRIFFTPKDSIALYSYDIKKQQTVKICAFESPSFKVPTLSGELKQMDRRSRSAYLKQSSMSIMLFPDNDGNLNLMTLEGETRQTDNGVSNDNRFFAVYSLGYQDNIAYYDIDSFSYWHLFSYKNGNVFFIKHSIINDDDRYSLNSISIQRLRK